MALTDQYCPHFHHTIELLGRRWTGVIVRVLATAPRRFGDIRAAIPGLSDRLLTNRLQELEAEGLVDRCERDGNACYRLSEKGAGAAASPRRAQLVAQRWACEERPAERPGRIRSDRVQ